MKAITLQQPWATLVAIGAKRIETRSWRTHYRGPIAIHASSGFPHTAKVVAVNDPAGMVLRAAGYGLTDLPRGAIVAVAKLYTVWPADKIVLDLTDAKQANEHAFGNYADGRYGWYLQAVRRIDPIECKGALGLWTVPAHVEREIREAIAG